MRSKYSYDYLLSLHVGKKVSRAKNNRLRIYIAGPYTASSGKEIEKNVNNAIDAEIKVLEKGHYPYIPHLTHYIRKRPSCKLTWEDFIQWDRIWIETCDAVLLLEESKGAHLEVEFAKSLGKKIYKSIEEVPQV